ncbi:molybdopterin-dependent oxidoreductase [Saccharospirillum alexandrii]|uniref:molybdopterin-containing oxidoreductase family protein n=1 Tax=Saccharospirillum alexandrii TaxID=2448477 RepID=UPI003735FC09
MTHHRSVCPLDCPDACALRVTVEDGRVTRVAGHPDHPVTQGAICHKVQRFPERTHAPERLLYPMRRVRPKGLAVQRATPDDFERISWEEALAEIAQRFKSIIAGHGAEAILPYSFYGNMGVLSAESMDRRFFNRLGACHLDRTICNSAATAGSAYTLGAPTGVDPEDSVRAKLILVWGCNIVSTNMHQLMLANEARKRGATLVVIDVHRNRTARWGDRFYQVKPGSDAALALGMMHVLIRDDLVDHAFIEQYALGYRELVDHVQNYNPEAVAHLTGLTPKQVEELAHLYGSADPALIRLGNGLQHHDNGGMIMRTITCLPALTGQWGKRGGGLIKGNGWYAQFNTTALQRPDLHPNPHGRRVNMNQLADALLDDARPIQALFVYNSNPAQVAPDQTRLRQGLLRPELFIVVHELFLSDTCAYADIVLPATSHFENLDLYKSYWHLYVQLNEPVLPIQGECRSNPELFRNLAAEMGFEDDCFKDTDEALIEQALNSNSPYLEGIDLPRLRRDGWAKLKVPEGGLFPHRIPTPSGKFEFYSATMAARGLPPLPEHTPLDEQEGRYPLAFITPPNHRFLNSTCSNDERMQRLEGERPTVQLHPQDAQAEGIVSGDPVVVFNNRGSCELVAEVTEDVLPGTAVSLGLWWDDPQQGLRSVNHLTDTRISDMGGGATFFSVRVGVRKRLGETPGLLETD